MITAEQMCRIPSWLANRGPESAIVTSTRIRLARNLVDSAFPVRASLQERKIVFDRVVEACQRVAQCRDFTVTNFAPLRPLAQQFLMEERAASPELVAAEGDRGLIADAERRIGVLVNEEDHLRLQALDSGLCAEALLASVDTLDTALGTELRYAYDRRRGYLTACPTNAGTGLRVSFLMHLPGLVLTKAVEGVLQAASQMGMCARGFLGEHSQIVGSFFQISNQATMGATEAEYLKSTEALVRHVVSLEREAREKLLAHARGELADKVYRSFGILRYARSLSVAEFLNLSSALRIGIDTEILKGIATVDINRLMLVALPAHIQTLYDRSMDEGELAAMRAEIVRTFLKQKLGDL